MKLLLPFLCATTLLASCSGNNQGTLATTGTADNAPTGSVSVADLDQQFVSAWNNKDAAKATALLADDVQFMQGESHFSGKSDVTNKWITPTITTIANLRTNSISSGTDANTAYEAGTFTVDVPPSATEKAAGSGSGNYLFLWKKGSDGSWKLSLAQLEDLPVQVKR
ncbi:MAG: YybH family protein [Janthinobacterium lividum]